MRIQMGGWSEAHAKREDDRGGSAIHANGVGGGPLLPDTRRVGYCVSGRIDSLRDREQSNRERLSVELHERSVRREGRIQAAGGRAVLGIRRGNADLRQIHVELRRRRRRKRKRAGACRRGENGFGDRKSTR